MHDLSSLRRKIRETHLTEESQALDKLMSNAAISREERADFTKRAVNLISDIRNDDEPGLMEVFLAEYGLSTDEGVALMCLAEALLRVPDAQTMDDLIEDKIAPSSWGLHLGQSSSPLVNASTWGLMLTGKVLDDDESKGIVKVLHGTIKRLGEPVIRLAVKRAMKEMGNQFVLGQTIVTAYKRGLSKQKKGFTYSYDMLGEAALTSADAHKYFSAYQRAITFLSQKATADDIRQNPGISIKLSALHPRYEVGKKDRVLAELVPDVLTLALMAREANMGLNIDAEEADRLDLSLDVIQAVLSDERLSGWDGFGVVVQAYGKRAPAVIDWLYALSESLGRKIMVRLVKGAYWDTEIKRAQAEGVEDFPVYTDKSGTDVAYICCAKKLLSLTDRIYPQFATHNAHSVSAILSMAKDKTLFEFQALHGMGEVLHRLVLENEGTNCRIYAPVGAHRDLLAYLVRRLLENGANSSFVNQIVDETVTPEEIAADPFETLMADRKAEKRHILKPTDLYAPNRKNSQGWDLHCLHDIAQMDAARSQFKSHKWTAEPILASTFKGAQAVAVINPADMSDDLGHVIDATEADVEAALSAAKPWIDSSPEHRRDVLMKAADLFEENFGEIFALLTREAGKTPADTIAELREAVDFLRYYALDIEKLEIRKGNYGPRGVFACISPWNFPLAIFAGQIAAALAAGNGVIAKPAETTPLIAGLAVKLLHQAGVPKTALQLVPGPGRVVGAKITSDPRINGVCFTGSTATAQHINRAMAEGLDPEAPLIAETGGLNAMIVDSTALPEQAVRDIVASSFQSAGQRCSALRLLYLQEDIAPIFLKMLYGAMDELRLGAPWDLRTDVGPIIDEGAKQKIVNHIQKAKSEGRLLKTIEDPEGGYFVGPSVISVSGLKEMGEEIFGPVLHVTTYKPNKLNAIIDEINDSGFGLTFGLHTRIDDRVEKLTQNLNVGNMYINRNQIGAIVGSQPFGGEGMSGTGPKAGGPHYVKHFTQKPIKRKKKSKIPSDAIRPSTELLQVAIDTLSPRSRMPLETLDLPGPTGESNRLSTYPRGRILCLGPGLPKALKQASIARSKGCSSLIICHGAVMDYAVDGVIDLEQLSELQNFEGVALWGTEAQMRVARKALAARKGPILPILTKSDMIERCIIERHICVDTTASGGNVSLLTGV
ncbi:L-proline dehydrogenase /delta-1-pyrroline-5-carboxylate dehydrogenase [Litorimonas taeanensis]|uniref:Bifunctional protein PutA n=1 Tax=Litorimonas taeanensis TaxID=568099 RepID=A0A420WJF1_9PROT|nr:bifunctional proline dehydrogenase/L-glutamate gamma-semialdehyde dehydrogenase PutA [Litorimonas taeanensis]RKQ71140.1 L-proline dehydrogenase /delta-1-pyrroline-5-carboxylate dehydrogenase [Litorimonas taeanensis]